MRHLLFVRIFLCGHYEDECWDSLSASQRTYHVRLLDSFRQSVAMFSEMHKKCENVLHCAIWYFFKYCCL